MKGSPGFYRHVLPALLYVLGIFVGGSLPHGVDTGLDFTLQDKVLHFVVFGGLVVVVQRALSALLPGRRQGTRLWLATATAWAVGGLLELWQAFLPSRRAELGDWLADALGALLAALVVWRVGREGWGAEPAQAPVSKR
jgi:hypothetical protein